jgi:hypothetical protein
MAASEISRPKDIRPGMSASLKRSMPWCTELVGAERLMRE